MSIVDTFMVKLSVSCGTKFTIYQIFSLARDFRNCPCCEKYLKDNLHDSLHLIRKYAQIFVLAKTVYPRQHSPGRRLIDFSRITMNNGVESKSGCTKNTAAVLVLLFVRSEVECGELH